MQQAYKVLLVQPERMELTELTAPPVLRVRRDQPARLAHKASPAQPEMMARPVQQVLPVLRVQPELMGQ